MVEVYLTLYHCVPDSYDEFRDDQCDERAVEYEGLVECVVYEQISLDQSKDEISFLYNIYRYYFIP